MVLPTAAAVRQSCSVVLSWYGTISYKKHTNMNKYKERLSTNVIFKRSLHFMPACHLTEAAEGAEAAAVRGSRVEAGRASQAPIKVITYYNSSHTRKELQAAAARGLDCCWAAGS